MITHYDLFAGIGGFSIALEEVFTDATIKHIFCEWESFPTAVLKKHWPNGEYWGDIADLVAHTSSTRLQGELHRYEKDESGIGKASHIRGGDEHNASFTIVTGGFPCQPFSQAGRRRGTADNRYQWPNMFAVIRNVKPEWVIAENVRGLVTWNDGLVLEKVCTDLEGEGYEVQPLIIPAVAVNAPHRRDRVWIVAHRFRERLQGSGTESKLQKPAASSRQNEHPDWNRSWQEVAFTTCDDAMDDGLPRLVDGVPYSRAKWRKHSLKAYGNGIVPQVAIEIIKAIKSAKEDS